MPCARQPQHYVTSDHFQFDMSRNDRELKRTTGDSPQETNCDADEWDMYPLEQWTAQNDTTVLGGPDYAWVATPFAILIANVRRTTGRDGTHPGGYWESLPWQYFARLLSSLALWDNQFVPISSTTTSTTENDVVTVVPQLSPGKYCKKTRFGCRH